MANAAERVTGLIRKNLNSTEEDISRDSNIFSLGIDSISVLGLIVDIETDFDLSFDDDELETRNFTTVDSICELLKKKGYV